MSNTPAGFRLRPLLNMALVLVLCSGATFAVYRAIEAVLDHFPHAYEHPLRWSNHANTLWLTKELADRTRPAILFAGSSTTRTAFDEQIVEEMTRNAYYVENISNSTTDPAGIYYWLKWLAKHKPEALPDVLIEGVEEMELQDETTYGPYHSHLTHFFADEALMASDPLYSKELRKPARRWQAYLESTFPLYSRRTLLQGLVVGSIIWPFYHARILDRHWLPRFHLRRYTWNYFRVASKSTVKRRLHGLRHLARDGDFIRQHYRFPNTQTKALRRIAEFCADHGILHYAVVMPGVPEKFEKGRLGPELVAQMRKVITDAYVGTPTKLIFAWHFLSGEDFFDSLHINQWGRGPLTRMVVTEMITDQQHRGLPSPYNRKNEAQPLPPPSPQSVLVGLADRSRYIVKGDELRKRGK